MKSIIFKLTLLTSLCISCREIDSIPLTHEFLTSCEKGNKSCTPIELSRKNSYFKFVANFRSDFDVYSISVYDSTYFDINTYENSPQQTGSAITETKKLKHQVINPSKEFSLNFTKIPDGKYFISISGTKKGYIFPVTLKSTQ